MDWSALYAALDATRAARYLLWKDVARETGLNASTFSRLRSGHTIETSAYAACCRWMGVSLDTFADPAPTAGANLATDLILVFSRHKVPEVYWGALTSLVTNLTPGQNKAPTVRV